jgi:hypothetical protein
MQRDTNGFTVISKRIRKRATQNTLSTLVQGQTRGDANETHLDDDCDRSDHKFNSDYFVQQIQGQSRRFANSSFVCGFDRLLQDELKQLPKPIDEIVCYGLGKFATDRSARDQLKFLIHLTSRFPRIPCFVYDPVFTDDEKQVLIQLQLQLIVVNENCCRPVQEGRFVLFYMPHCHKFMFNNLLWSNWNVASLNGLLLIGNSFDRMTSFLDEPNDATVYSYLHQSVKQKLVREVPIYAAYVNLHGFHDISIHTFPVEDDNKLTRCHSPSPPTYPLLD